MSGQENGQSPRLTLSMIVRNEAERYLTKVLESARTYISDAVIIDDGSTDGTVALCRELLDGIPHTIIENKESRFHEEWKLRAQQWEETVKTKPEWILFLDADEVFEKRFQTGVNALLGADDCDVYLFRLYDFWDETHYRDDELWRAHRIYRPFLLRYRSEAEYVFKRAEQHCGRMPENVFDFNYRLSAYRLKHLGWAKEADRAAKFKRYRALDPHGVFGSLAQYRSILDENPNVVLWEEDG